MVIPVPSGERLSPLFAGLPPVHEVIVVVAPGAEAMPALPRAARVIRQTRHGVGNAVACGVAAATGDVVVTLPGDGSCDPAELPRLTEALRTGADVAEGVRYRPAPPETGPSSATGAFPDTDRSERRARYGDLILLWFMNVLFGCRPADPGSGFRAFRRDRADRLGLPRVAGTSTARGDGRDGEPLLIVRSRAAGLRVAEVPVTALPGAGSSPLMTGMHALTREYLARRRNTRAAATDSIVILTGGGPAAGLPEPGSPRSAGSHVDGTLGRTRINLPGVNPARTTLPDRHAAYEQGPRRWPAPNQALALNHAGSGGFDHPNSPGLGFPDRRGTERRGPDRRRTDSASDRWITGSGRPAVPGAQGRPPVTGGRGQAVPHGRQGNDRLLGGVVNRRRWRDDHGDGRPRSQGRPNLRVINGEGGGSDGSRGQLRPVPRPDQP
ncbi:glycosyltransferase [Actinoplanes sp. NEAU-A12]|uniref:Glycosyltransferase n=1 Tax=Actinoplanes sandaracinus TaxID=3045177 RepID=A0ABT6WPD3_9ACTN|nr:glycosyltransferase [Actinoplanes sandaracinus]MDI6101556.1 glycosyltransferase [Actinoplanes sandaracinus]